MSNRRRWTSPLRVVGATVAAAALAGAGCTIFLNTEELVTACASGADCDDGFFCSGGACLPEGGDGGVSPEPDPAPENDAGANEPDPGPENDAGANEPDPAPEDDAGANEPDPAPEDAGVEDDAGTPEDGGAEVDAGAENDAGPSDAGAPTDAGASDDAGVIDGGTTDAG